MNTIKKADGFLNEYIFVLPEEWLTAVSCSGLFRSLVVTDIGYFPEAHNHYRERPRGCDTTILLYCSAGKGSVRLGEQEHFTLDEGEAVLIPPDTPHLYSASQDAPWSVYWLHLKGDLIASYLQLIGACKPLRISSQYNDDIIHEFYYCFEAVKMSHEEEYFLVCQSAGKILAMLAVASKLSRQQFTKRDEAAIEKCIRFMKLNLSRPLSLEQLAAESGFSRSHLNVLFKQATGHAPINYFLRMKMQAASKDLYFSTRSVKEISLDYGIQDPFYFSRIFKRVMKLSPSAYRAQAQDMNGSAKMP